MSDTSKTCFKCSRFLPLSEFYPHPQMADGHLNKCKDCNKRDTNNRVARKKLDPNWLIQEAARCREKENRRRQSDGYQANPQHSADKNRNYEAKFPFKKKAHGIVCNAIRSGLLTRQSCGICGAYKTEAHHEDYSKPLDVVWLCKKHHMARHVEINDLKRINQCQTTLA